MTNISGKIYQMQNAAGTENRFPRTVMEAVLGLNTYLQQQFNALADIYMPIEGISEALNDQEFVYRISPASIKAKSLTLDRILGRTLAWNQLVTNGNFSNGFNSWAKDGAGTWSLSGGVAHIHRDGGSAGTTMSFRHDSIPCIIGHKYLYLATVRTTSGKLSLVATGSSSQGQTPYTEYLTSTRLGYIWTAVASSAIWELRGYDGYEANVDIDYYASNVNVFDLTLLYGSEIDGMTDAEILAKFEREFPGYHDYSAGKLISNDASEIETVGRNVWDEEWRKGYYGETTGEYTEGQYVCTKNPIKILGGQTYYFYCGSSVTNMRMYVSYYDTAGNLINTTTWSVVYSGHEFTVPSNAVRMNLWLLSAYGTTYNHDICINLSDTNFNGQYEPYRKSILPLNLDDFWVKDGQGNQVHITGGLKSAGSVYDEIVGNKYIKRMKRVDLGSLNWYKWGAGFGADLVDGAFRTTNIICAKYSKTTDTLSIYNGTIDKAYAAYDDFHGGNSGILIIDSAFNEYTGAQVAAALSEVMFDYELATPIEYDLVEPLIYTTKAGTTEERISPNSDGLSAPFCCDMTYSANENNDAGNAQYAATAGRLLNTHKIWGQDFNGSEDVSGALTGVTTLDASGLVTLRGGISVPATADAKHGTLDFIDGDVVKHIVVVEDEEDIPASPDLHTLYVVATTTV